MFVICRLVTFLCIFSQTSDDTLVYSAPTFSGRKSGRADRMEAKAEEEEQCIYSNVKALELD